MDTAQEWNMAVSTSSGVLSSCRLLSRGCVAYFARKSIKNCSREAVTHEAEEKEVDTAQEWNMVVSTSSGVLSSCRLSSRGCVAYFARKSITNCSREAVTHEAEENEVDTAQAWNMVVSTSSGVLSSCRLSSLLAVCLLVFSSLVPS